MPGINTENNNALLLHPGASPNSPSLPAATTAAGSLANLRKVSPSPDFPLSFSPSRYQHAVDLHPPAQISSSIISIDDITAQDLATRGLTAMFADQNSIGEYTAQHSKRTRQRQNASTSLLAGSTPSLARVAKPTVHYQASAAQIAASHDRETACQTLLSKLPTAVQQWYAAHPPEENPAGKASIERVAQHYRTHKRFLLAHGILQSQFATLYHVNTSYLGKVISEFNNREREISQPDEAQKAFLHQNPVGKTLSGNYQATTVSDYYVVNRAALTANGITLRMLAEYTKTNAETVRKRIYGTRNTTPEPLPEDKTAWLTAHPIKIATNNKVIRKHFNKLWKDNQEDIIRLGITPENIAQFHSINPKTLNEFIENIDPPPYDRKRPPTTEQHQYLSAIPWEKDNNGEVIIESLAKYYLENKYELMEQHITRHNLALFHGLRPGRLMIAIDKIPERSADKQFRQAQVKAWLQQEGPDKNAHPKIKESELAKFYWQTKNKPPAGIKLTVPDLIRYYGVQPSALNYYIDKYHAKKEKATPDEKQIAWLKENAPERNKRSQKLLENIAEFYANHHGELKLQGITNKKLATYYHYPVSTFKIKASIFRLKNSEDDIPPEIQAFMDKYRGQYLNAARLSELIVDHTPALEINISTASKIAEKFGLSAANLMRRIHELLTIREQAKIKPDDKAKAWLNEFDKQYNHAMHNNATNTALFLLKYKEKISELNITYYQIAARYNINPTTLKTTVARARVINKAAAWQPEQKAHPAPVIKQEPEDDEIRLWHQAAWGRHYPVVIPPEDSRIILGLEQGPLRELLNEEDVATLKFISYPAEYRRYLAEATRQMRILVQAAQNGTLRDLARQQGYYYLLCDEEHPELGMGLAAARDLDAGVVLQLYPGVKYTGQQQFLAAANDGDVHFPAYAFEHSGSRPRRKMGVQKKRPIQANTVIGGQHRTGDMVFVNTAKVDASGKVKPSESNNLIALKAGKAVIVYMTTRKIKKHEPLLIYYGEKYLINPHQPWPLTRQIKQEISEFEEKLQRLSVSQPALGWLVENIHQHSAWTQPVYELMPQLLALTPRYRQKNALLVLTDQENIIFKVIDSATGMDIDPETALDSQRPLAVLQNQDGNHYNCWWAKGGNVSFSLAQEMAGNRLYQVEVDDPCNFRQAIAPSGFCMSEAAAMALLARDARKPLLDADRQALGQQLREQVRDFILAADDARCHALEAQIPQE